MSNENNSKLISNQEKFNLLLKKTLQAKVGNIVVGELRGKEAEFILKTMLNPRKRK